MREKHEWTEIEIMWYLGQVIWNVCWKNLNSAAFVKAFMTSSTAKELDSEYNRMQWAGEEYLLEEVLASSKELKRNSFSSFFTDRETKGKISLFKYILLFWIEAPHGLQQTMRRFYVSSVFPILSSDGRYIGITIRMMEVVKGKYWNFTRNCSRALSLYTVP